ATDALTSVAIDALASAGIDAPASAATVVGSGAGSGSGSAAGSAAGSGGAFCTPASAAATATADSSPPSHQTPVPHSAQAAVPSIGPKAEPSCCGTAAAARYRPPRRARATRPGYAEAVGVPTISPTDQTSVARTRPLTPAGSAYRFSPSPTRPTPSATATRAGSRCTKRVSGTSQQITRNAFSDTSTA